MANRSPAAERALRAASWTASAHLLGMVLRLGVIGVLARLLTPEDFGKLAGALILITLGETLAPLGTASALVRLKVVSRQHVDACATISFVSASLLTFILPVVAYLAEGPIEVPDLALTTLALTPCLFFGSLQRLASRLLQREMNLRPVALIEIGSFLIGFGWIGIMLAHFGANHWSLVAAQVSMTVLSGVGLAAAVRTLPRPSFDRAALRELLTFGRPAAGATLLEYAAFSSPRVIVALALGATALGLYARADDLMRRFGSTVERLLTNVLYPVLAAKRDERDQLPLYLTRIVAVLTLALAPASLLAMILAPEIVLILLGSQWTELTVPFRLLLLILPFLFLRRAVAVVDLSIGRPEVTVSQNLLLFIVVTACALALVGQDITGVAIASLVASVQAAAFALLRLARGLGVAGTRLLVALRPGLLASSAMAVLAFATKALMLALGLTAPLGLVLVTAPVASLMTLALLWGLSGPILSEENLWLKGEIRRLVAAVLRRDGKGKGLRASMRAVRDA